jgi:hypothetical protein
MEDLQIEGSGLRVSPDRFLERLCTYSIVEMLLLGSIWSAQIGTSSVTFYVMLVSVALLVSLVLTLNTTRTEQFVLLCATTLLLRLIVPLAKPASVVDNFPDAYVLRNDILFIMKHGTSSTDTASSSYRYYPGASFLLTMLSLATGIGIDPVLKYFPVILILPIFGAIPILVRALGFKDTHIEALAMAIVSFIPFLIGANPHASPFNFGTILLFLALAFYFESVVGSKTSYSILFALVVSAVVICSIIASIFLVLITGAFVVLTLLFRRSLEIRLGMNLFAFTVMTFLLWYLFPAIALSGNVVTALSHEMGPELRILTITTPTGLKPMWMVIEEYVAFLYFGLVLLGSLFGKSEGSRLPRLVAVSGILASILFVTPWILGLSTATELISRILLIVSFVGAPIMAASLCSLRSICMKFGSVPIRLKIGVLMAGGLITLLVLNSVIYGMPTYYYDHSIPQQPEDTRGLEFWIAIGSYLSGTKPNSTIWGPRLGATFVGEYAQAQYYQFVVPTTRGQIVAIEAASFPSIAIKLRDQYVLISKSMDAVPEAPGYLPNIEIPLSSCTRIYDNGELVLLVAYAPAQ